MEQRKRAEFYGWSRRDLILLSVLVLSVGLLRVAIVSRTEVCARDTVSFVRYALDFEEYSFAETLCRNPHHPGYPLTILVTSWPLRYFAGATSPETMQLSAQIASSLAAILLIFPMYALGRMFFSRRISFLGTLMFQFLPVSGMDMSDGLSEAFFFLCAITAILFAIISIRRQRWQFMLLAGAFGGFAYLTRPEGGLLLLAIGSVLLVKQAVPDYRWSWANTVRAGAALTVSATVVGGIYIAATGKLSNKPSASTVLTDLKRLASDQKRLEVHGPAFTEVGSRHVARTPLMLANAIFGELGQAFHYFGGLAASFGIWSYRRLFRIHPGTWVLLAWGAFHLAAVWLMASRFGYVSDRHVLVVVSAGCFFAAAGIRDFSLLLTRIWNRRTLPDGWWRRARRLTIATSLVFLVFSSMCLAKTLRPLHRKHVAHRYAGYWLADNIRPGDAVFDDHGLAHFYSGIMLERERQPDTSHRRKCYFVLFRSGFTKERHLQRQVALQQAGGVCVFHWPTKADDKKAKLVIYAIYSDQLPTF